MLHNDDEKKRVQRGRGFCILQLTLIDSTSFQSTLARVMCRGLVALEKAIYDYDHFIFVWQINFSIK